MTDATDFDFRHHLRDTILLLGGKKDIADLLLKSEDGFVSEADVERNSVPTTSAFLPM
jgi:hypothetical protein